MSLNGVVPADGSRLLFCGKQAADWTSLVVRRVADPAVVEDLVLPPVDAQHLVLPTRGRKSVESYADGRWRRPAYGPNQIGMTAPGRSSQLRWTSTSDEPLETLHVYLPGEALRRTALQLWGDDRIHEHAACTPVPDPMLAQVMLGIAAAAEAAAPDLYAESVREFLTVHVLLRYGGRPEARGPSREDARIVRATEYMRENLGLPLTLADIAREAGLSSYHFLRLFKAATGTTPVRHLVDLRIALGRRQLERSSMQVSEIAHVCGFASAAHFSTVFSRKTGVSPSAYRDMHRK